VHRILLRFVRFEIFIVRCAGTYFFRAQCIYDGVLASAPGTPVGECCPPVAAIPGAAPVT